MCDCGIRLLVKLRFSYRNRDGSIFASMVAEKRFKKPFVPAVGSHVMVEVDDYEVGGEVLEVWWRSHAESDEIVVHTKEEVYCDGNVLESMVRHMSILGGSGWLCTPSSYPPGWITPTVPS